jgi:hypothetical protein
LAKPLRIPEAPPSARARKMMDALRAMVEDTSGRRRAQALIDLMHIEAEAQKWFNIGVYRELTPDRGGQHSYAKLASVLGLSKSVVQYRHDVGQQLDTAEPTEPEDA